MTAPTTTATKPIAKLPAMVATRPRPTPRPTAMPLPGSPDAVTS
jgi:hypothetical protein